MLPQLETSTQTTYSKLLAWWRETLMDTDVKHVTPEMLEDFKYVLLRDKRYSPSRVNLYLASLSSVFTYGASRRVKWLDHSPFIHVKRLKEEPRKPRITDGQRQV